MNLIVSAPSGSGKTTILKQIFEKYPNTFGFSVSATTRTPRQGEIDGKDYHFLTLEEFNAHIANQDFLEYEQVYEGLFYGTLKSEIDRINQMGMHPVFDVDVKGGMNIKKILSKSAYSVFIMPPSIEVLRQRLENRKTENEKTLRARIERAEMEIKCAKYFDKIIINDDLSTAVEEFSTVVDKFILR